MLTLQTSIFDELPKPPADHYWSIRSHRPTVDTVTLMLHKHDETDDGPSTVAYLDIKLDNVATTVIAVTTVIKHQAETLLERYSILDEITGTGPVTPSEETPHLSRTELAEVIRFGIHDAGWLTPVTGNGHHA